MRKHIRMMTAAIIAALTAAMSAPLMAQNTDNTEILSIMTEAKTDWNFSDESVKEEDIQAILEAGVNTASAINEQPWHFSVITDADIIAELADTPESAKAPVLILVSVTDGNEMKILDGGLATQSMQITARILGYATKIETSAARTVRNDQTGYWNELLDIPDGKTARAALFVGYKEEGADAVSTASTRGSFDELVSFIE